MALFWLVGGGTYLNMHFNVDLTIGMLLWFDNWYASMLIWQLVCLLFLRSYPYFSWDWNFLQIFSHFDSLMYVACMFLVSLHNPINTHQYFTADSNQKSPVSINYGWLKHLVSWMNNDHHEQEADNRMYTEHIKNSS